jgi:hypothetical protein
MKKREDAPAAHAPVASDEALYNKDDPRHEEAVQMYNHIASQAEPDEVFMYTLLEPVEGAVDISTSKQK